MSRMVRRFEVLLPLRFNDGTPIPDAAVVDTLIEFEEQFGAVSCETQTIRGRWRSDGQSYRDDLIRVFVDAPDGTESREYFVAAKERLKARFQQLDIWLTTYLIEVLMSGEHGMPPNSLVAGTFSTWAFRLNCRCVTAVRFSQTCLRAEFRVLS